MGQSILAIPHVGTGLGHLIRLGEFISQRYTRLDDVHLVVPEHVKRRVQKHYPAFVSCHFYNSSFTVTSPSGYLDIQSALNVADELRSLIGGIKFDQILGSPGIEAAILSWFTSIPWTGLMHGCYLEPPKALIDDRELGHLAELAWAVSRKGIDQIIEKSTKEYSSWEEIRKKGQVLIANSAWAEPSSLGEHIGEEQHRIGWEAATPAPLLITLCSAGAQDIPDALLAHFVAAYGKVVVAGPATKTTQRTYVSNVEFVGSGITYESLIGPTTTVICHGGHGTLKAVRKAARVIVVPGDIDQLCNGLIAHHTRGYELAIADSWLERLNSATPFKRYVDWQALAETHITP